MRRVRYAPSPTGELHLGGLRTALFNWLFARQHPQGRFLVRIEDTDRTREVAGAAERLLDALERFGIRPDEPVPRQSERRHVHAAHAHSLVQNGGAYPCFCSAERLAQVRAASRKGSAASGSLAVSYDRRCRSVPAGEAASRMAQGEPHTIRLRSPLEGATQLDDLVKGRVTFSNSVMDDQILLKTDGFPTYHLASVVDDHDMGITHVIRGEEWLSSTPKHLHLYRSFGWAPPQFAHLPLLLNTDGTKVSKRTNDASVASLLDDRGFSPSAVLNFVALLGWSPARSQAAADALLGAGELEDDDGGEVKRKLIFPTTQSLIENFDLAGSTSKGAVVDLDLLHFINGEHIRAMDSSTIIGHVREMVPASRSVDDADIRAVLDLVQRRIFRLRDIPDYVTQFFERDIAWDEADRERAQTNNPVAHLVLDAAMTELGSLGESDWTAPKIKKLLSRLPKAMLASNPAIGKAPKAANVMLPVRWASTGSLKGAELPETLALLGREAVLDRIARKRNAFDN